MSISQPFILAALALVIGQIKAGRTLALLGVSAFLIYWLQPVQGNVRLTFWLPTTTIVLTILIWLLTSTPDVRGWKQNTPAALVLSGGDCPPGFKSLFSSAGDFHYRNPQSSMDCGAFHGSAGFCFLGGPLQGNPPVVFVIALVGLVSIFVLVKVQARSIGWNTSPAI